MAHISPLLASPGSAASLARSARTVRIKQVPAETHQLLHLLPVRAPALVLVKAGKLEMRILYTPTYTETCLCRDGVCEPVSPAGSALLIEAGDAVATVYELPSRLYCWSPSMSVYVKGIDLQHRQLVKALNSLYTALLNGATRTRIGGLLGFLEEYSSFHFRSEETFFEKIGYPWSEEHKREHAWFVRKVAEFRREYGRGKRSLDVDVLLFLAKWVKGHIMGSDKKYGEWAVREGVVPQPH